MQLGEAPFTSALSQAVAVTAERGSLQLHVHLAGRPPRRARSCSSSAAAPAAYTALPGQRLAARRRGGAAVRAGHRPAGPGQPGRLPARRARSTPPWSPTPPTPLPWQLKNAAGDVVAQRHDHAARAWTRPPGRTCTPSTSAPHRTPAPATRWSPTARPATRSTSPPTVYDQLRSDALQFFYTQRSGIAIDGALRRRAYARPAGHLGVAPNQGDTDVPCQPGVCDYRLDVRGGWYDAGDHGKYVVNGGIATCQLLNTYERTKTAPTGSRRGARRRHAARPRARQRRPGHPRRGPLGAGVPAAHAGAGRASRSPAWRTTRSTTRTGPGCRCSRRTTRSRASCTRRRTAATLNLAAVGGAGRPAVRALRPGVRRAAA